MVNNSSRPSSIATVHTQVWKSDRTANVVDGPTRFKPGPTLLTQAIMAVNPVTISAPEKNISNVKKMMEVLYKKTNTNIEYSTDVPTGCPLSLITICARG